MKIKKLKDTPEVLANHEGNILKKVLVKKGEIPHLMMFSSATFKPKQKVEAHKHDTMYEVFYIQQGKAEFIIDDKKIIVSAGDCITIEPEEIHSQSNPFEEEVTWLYFGIATDE